MNRKWVFAALLSAAAMSACKKSESGEGSLGYRIEATNLSSNLSTTTIKSASEVSVDVTTPGITWSSGSVTAGKISFEAKKGKNKEETNKEAIHLELVNPPTIDIFGLNTLLGNIQLPTGVYKEVELKILLKKSESAPSLLLEGKFKNGQAVETPLQFKLNDEVNLKIEHEDISATGVDFVSVINFELDKLFAQVTPAELNSATRTNGVIVISSTSNTALYTKVKTALASCPKGKLKDKKTDDADEKKRESERKK